MTFIPKIKQIIGGKIPGILKDPKTGFKYLGPFVQDHLGNFFKGTKITEDSKPLDFIPETKEAEKQLGLINVYVRPSEKDYENGYLLRYFVKDGRSGIVVEVDKDAYLREKKESKLYRRTLKIQWYIKGNPEDEIINGYIYPGVKAKNQDVIDQAEKILPGIGEQTLKDTSQFVRK